MARRRREKPARNQSVVAADVQFERELEVFRTEAETAAQFFYAYLEIHASAGADISIYHLLNSAPLFWNTILGGLQTGAFVVLGRIFDRDSAHNVGRLLRLAQDNLQIFSKPAFARRRQGKNQTPPQYLADYLQHVYVPKPADFRRLRGYVSKQRKIYLDKYQPLRDRVFAHKELSDAADLSALLARTKVRDIERMLVFLMSLYEALWQLFVNGRKPVLRPHRYSVKRMRDRAAQNTRGGSVHERLVQEGERFLKAASAVQL
jgi:hypothetical protein